MGTDGMPVDAPVARLAGMISLVVEQGTDHPHVSREETGAVVVRLLVEQSAELARVLGLGGMPLGMGLVTAGIPVDTSTKVRGVESLYLRDRSVLRLADALEEARVRNPGLGDADEA